VKQTKEIAALQSTASSITFPKASDIAFHNWKVKLMGVLGANGLYDASHKLTWFADGGCFTWQETFPSVIADMQVSVEVTFSIYPFLDIAKQIKQVLEKRKQMVSACFQIAKEQRTTPEG